MEEKCELCDTEIKNRESVTQEGHIVCYDCVETMNQVMDMQRRGRDKN